MTDFTDTDAQALYDKYLSKGHAEDGMEAFMSDVVNAFTSENNTTDIVALKSHLAAIQWMAGMFGNNSSEILTQLIDAQIDYAKDQNKFVADRKSPVENLNKHERNY